MSLFNNGSPAKIQYTAKCKLCGKDVARTVPLNIPVVGHPGKLAEEYGAVLFKHHLKHHQKEYAQGIAIHAEFQAFLILSGYEHEDPSIAPRLELIRAAMYALVRKNALTDASLQHVIASWGLDPDNAAKVFEGMKAVRDACCEFGAHAPKLPQGGPQLVLRA